MAYSTIEVVINGKTKDAIDVTGDGASVILEENLTPFDKEVMNAVSAEDGETFAAKLAAHKMSNGMTADVVYANLIKVVSEHNEATFKAYAANNTAKVLLDHDTRIASLEVTEEPE